MSASRALQSLRCSDEATNTPCLSRTPPMMPSCYYRFPTELHLAQKIRLSTVPSRPLNEKKSCAHSIYIILSFIYSQWFTLLSCCCYNTRSLFLHLCSLYLIVSFPWLDFVSFHTQHQKQKETGGSKGNRWIKRKPVDLGSCPAKRKKALFCSTNL